MTRRFGVAVVALAVAATTAIALGTSRAAEAGQQPAFPQAFGWARVADSVLSLFDR
jgi:hypothetical protein